ncbi:6-bladed beta-propeller [Calditrichota bacterium LG25]
MRKNFIIIVVLILFNCGFASETYRVVWVAEYSNKTLSVPSVSLGEKLINFFFGKEHIRMQRPFTLNMLDAGHYLFLDQGAGYLGTIDLKNKALTWLTHKKNFLLFSAVDICMLNKDSVLITDGGLNKIFLYDLKKNRLKIWNDSLNIDHPTGIAYCPQRKQVVVVETGKHRLLFLDKSGNVLRVLGKRGLGHGEFNFPTFIWIDNSGTIYVNDSMNFRIQIFDFDGTFRTVFGKLGDVSGYLARPKGIATDTNGNIYVVDALFNVVQVFDQQGNLLTYFGGQGKKAGQFWMPTGIYIDSQDRILVADSFNSRIQEFKLKKQGKP